MTAETGGATGTEGGGGGDFGALPPDEPPADEPPDDEPPVDDEPPDALDVLGPPEWNGSLLSKSENDCSWPASAGGFTELTSCFEAALVPAVLPSGVAPASDGALGSADAVAGVGVDAAGVVLVSAATCGLADDEPLRDVIVCTA
jgi:hypothetical protein